MEEEKEEEQSAASSARMMLRTCAGRGCVEREASS